MIENLKELEERTKEAELPLKDTASNLVFGKGNPKAEIVFIGEAPGEQEDVEGKPFVGRAGKELDKLLSTIGLGLVDVYICNILKYRPPKNRDPNVDEIIAHTPYLVEQLKIINPKVIITLGNYSTKFILAKCQPSNMKTVGGISTLHGKPQSVLYEQMSWTVIPFYHPAAMLYRPQLRAVLEEDVIKVGKLLGRKIKGPQKTLESFSQI